MHKLLSQQSELHRSSQVELVMQHDCSEGNDGSNGSGKGNSGEDCCGEGNIIDKNGGGGGDNDCDD
jgi:hypothetical protein